MKWKIEYSRDALKFINKKGKIRIIFSLNKNEKSLFIEKIDFRGDVYK